MIGAKQQLPHYRSKQGGVVLFMSLIFLLVLTIIGVAAMKATGLEEKMMHSSKDINLAFQAAETTLVHAERWLTFQSGLPPFPTTSSGLYDINTCPTADKQMWQCDDILDWVAGTNVIAYPGDPYNAVAGAGAYTPPTGGIQGVRTQPRYIIEFVTELMDEGGSLVEKNDGTNNKKTILRITARGTGGLDNTSVLLQSTYARYF